MKRWVDVCCCLALLGALFILAHQCTACTPVAGENARTAGDYEAAQLACVDHAKTREEADACRCTVKAQYGRPCADGGAR